MTFSLKFEQTVDFKLIRLNSNSNNIKSKVGIEIKEGNI
jgi:hypothetical protein